MTSKIEDEKSCVLAPPCTMFSILKLTTHPTLIVNRDNTINSEVLSQKILQMFLP